jgi:hypothetical protein
MGKARRRVRTKKAIVAIIKDAAALGDKDALAYLRKNAEATDSTPLDLGLFARPDLPAKKR